MPGTSLNAIAHRGRSIVLCFDGTAEEYAQDNSNVVKFYALLQKNNSNQQICYYQAGIGTYFSPGVVSPVFEWFAKIMDDAFAWYLDAHVMDGYRFLMQNWNEGDKICLFGFSRGAYTARALAGMLHKVGLLQKDNSEQLYFAYKTYKTNGNDSFAAGFRRTFCQDVSVEFVGVWDTVASVGMVYNRTLPFTSSNTAVKTFRHALSLDEHRCKFRPNLYHRPAPNAAGAAKDPEGASPVLNQGEASSSDTSGSDGEEVLSKRRRPSWFKNRRSSARAKKGKIVEQFMVKDGGNPTDVLEVWFVGAHSDIGGSAVPDTDPQNLGNITLRWMIRQVIEAQCGIIFDSSALELLGFPLVTIPMTKHTEVNVPSSEKQLDVVDALDPIHDELVSTPLWWILEVIPMGYAWQDKDGVWHKGFGPNLGRGRAIQDPHPTFHITVKERMQDPEMKYKPKAIFTPGTEVYVE